MGMKARKKPTNWCPPLRTQQFVGRIVSYGAERRTWFSTPPLSNEPFDANEDRISEALECSGVPS